MKPSSVLALLALTLSLQIFGQNNAHQIVRYINSTPDSLRNFTTDIGAANEFTIGDMVTGVQGSVYLKTKNSQSLFQLSGAYYWLNSDKYASPFPSSVTPNLIYFQWDILYGFLPWHKEKIRSTSINVRSFQSINGPVTLSSSISNNQLVRFGFRIGFSKSQLPVRALNAGGLGLKYLRDEKSNKVLYPGEYRTTGSTSLLTFGFHRRKIINIRYDLIDSNSRKEENCVKAVFRDIYFDLTYLAGLQYAYIVDNLNVIQKNRKRSTYSIRPEDNPIYPLGWRLGIQTQNLSGKHIGLKLGAEAGCRYGINSSSFSFGNNELYYFKFTAGIILLTQKRR
ncbi:MAG: hypothetical protein GC180_12855 [Bacteroidetes bacterium]|nr:hypothetical protein [Bacteroidota bacterium]